jgi:hypothetical protein
MVLLYFEGRGIVDKVSVLGSRGMMQAVCMISVIQVHKKEKHGRSRAAGQQSSDEQVQGRMEAWGPWRPWRIWGGGSSAAFAHSWAPCPLFIGAFAM